MTPARRRGGTRPSSSPTSCRCGPPAAGSRASGCGTTRAGGECSLASLTSLTYVGDELRSIDYSEPAAALLPGANKTVGA